MRSHPVGTFLIGYLWLVPILMLGAVATALAVLVSGLEFKFQVTVIFGLASAIGLLILRDPVRIRAFMVAIMAFGLSIGFDKSFFHHYFVSGSYIRWVQGAAAITITLSLLAAIGYLAVWGGEAWLLGRRRAILIERTLVFAALIFMAVGALSLVNAHDPWLVMLEEIRLASLLFLSIMVMNFTRPELRLFFRCIAISILIQASLSAVQYATGKTLGLSIFGEETLVVEKVAYANVFRATGTIGHSNILAYFFEITMPLMLALGLVSRDILDRMLFLIATMAGLGGMILTMSRGAWMGIPVSIVVILYAVVGRRLFTLKAAIIAITLLGVVAIAAVFVGPIIAERLFGYDAGSSSHRIPLDLSALSVIEQFPFLGVGLNNFAVSFYHYDTLGNSRVFLKAYHVVHNLFLLVFGDVGALGLLAFLWYFATVFLVAARLSRKADSWSRAAALGVATGLFAHLLHGMVDPGFKLNLTISQLISASIGSVGCLALQLQKKSGG
jgi:O-antigen ligase